METRIIRINIKWSPWKRKKGQCSSDIRWTYGMMKFFLLS